ncbi:MAG: GspH/FimT family pseudopilin [Betaproteobacteria bacterium]|nr:GspH/FimT family pseudopilin [Betaproteobacteria bacterium]
MTKAWRDNRQASVRVRGFTLIELMVTIVVAAVLVGIAGPSLRGFLQRASLSSIAGEIHAAVARARQEAITRGTFVTITPRLGTNWSSGYQIFVNPLNSATFNAGDTVGMGTSIVSSEIISVKDESGWGHVDWPALTSDGRSPRTYFTFDDTGRPMNSNGTNMRPDQPHRVRICVGIDPCRELIVDHLGRIQVSRN